MSDCKSPPMWGCGLKCSIMGAVKNGTLSPPMWGCGLKCVNVLIMERAKQVTPYVGVWIEIPPRL